MPGSNCTFYGCSTSRKHKLSLFRIPTVAASDSDHTKSLKQNARAEWLRLILRTRESTPELQKRIDANNIYICELHFKQECVFNRYVFSDFILDSINIESVCLLIINYLAEQAKIYIFQE